jgi:RimJ/RimL family protein N-acetyltransferase
MRGLPAATGIMVSVPTGVSAPRVTVRPVVEADRSRFVAFFGDEDFMVFADGVLPPREAGARFDRMIARCAEIPFAKQAIVELASGAVVGYTGVDWIDLDGGRRLEWGYRLVPAVRGQGYATEASRALLTSAAAGYTGELITVIHPDNKPSRNVSRKLGFRFWKTAEVYGRLRTISLLRLP